MIFFFETVFFLVLCFVREYLKNFLSFLPLARGAHGFARFTRKKISASRVTNPRLEALINGYTVTALLIYHILTLLSSIDLYVSFFENLSLWRFFSVVGLLTAFGSFFRL